MDLQVPALADFWIETVATELLRYYVEWAGRPLKAPIRVDNVAEGFLGLTLHIGSLRACLDREDVLGALWLDEKRIMLDSSLESNDAQFDFTLAHEIAHWMLHRPAFEKQRNERRRGSRYPSSALPSIVCRSGSETLIEAQADQFATYLLLPTTLLSAATEATWGTEPLGIPRLRARLASGKNVIELKAAADRVLRAGGFSNVSRSTMICHLLKLELVVDASPAPRPPLVASARAP